MPLTGPLAQRMPAIQAVQRGCETVYYKVEAQSPLNGFHNEVDIHYNWYTV